MSTANLKIAVTGAAGNLGREVVRQLHHAGHRVIAVDRVRRPDLPVPVQVHDLLDREAAYQWIDGCDAVVHLGNHIHAGASDYQTVLGENVQMNVNVFQAAIESGVRRIAFASTVQVVSGLVSHWSGEDTIHFTYLPLDSDSPAQPNNSYAHSKRFAELHLEQLVRQHGIAAVAIRFPFLSRAEWITRVRQRGWGSPTEGFTHLPFDSAADLVARWVTSSLSGFRIYFPAARLPASGQPAADLIREHYPHVPLRRPLAEIHSLVDCRRIEAETGWVQPE
jgi:nucleoside-diphosphate-sugar epimerase